MAEQVKVTSIDALEAFRANLIVFLTAAHRSVDEVRDEVRRTRQWIQTDQRVHWEGQARKWRRALAQAEQELISAKLSALRDSTTMQENAVLKAKRALSEAEEKLRVVKIWNRDFDGRSDPLIKRLESLRQFLDFDMPKAISYLVQAQRTLEAYAESAPRSEGPAPAAESTEPKPA
jgi:hypothetical protein